MVWQAIHPALRRHSDPVADDSADPRALVEAIARTGVHELAAARFADMAAITGLALATLAAAPSEGPVLWVARAGLTREHGRLSGRGVAGLGLDPGRLILAEAAKPFDILWAIEEGLRSGIPAAVVAEAEQADFTATRRLSLASAATGVPAILLMPHGREGATGAQARWRVSAAPSAPDRYDRRAVGRPRWRVTLERSRLTPEAARRRFDVEFDDEALSLSVADRLADRPLAPRPAPPSQRCERELWRRAS